MRILCTPVRIYRPTGTGTRPTPTPGVSQGPHGEIHPKNISEKFLNPEEEQVYPIIYIYYKKRRIRYSSTSLPNPLV